jgi:hypothetical protein
MRSRSSLVAASVKVTTRISGGVRAEGGPVVAVAQHQAQVEGGDGEGLAGAGAGLDEAAAVQRETQGSRAVGSCLVSGGGRGAGGTIRQRWR